MLVFALFVTLLSKALCFRNLNTVLDFRFAFPNKKTATGKHNQGDLSSYVGCSDYPLFGSTFSVSSTPIVGNSSFVEAVLAEAHLAQLVSFYIHYSYQELSSVAIWRLEKYRQIYS